MQKPKVSVLLPVYNADAFVREAIDSILQQDFRDFELIITNDGSQDNTAEVIRSYADPRIVFIDNRVNQGLIGTLNEQIRSAKGEFLARMDADDISARHRLSSQLRWFAENPEAGIVTSFMGSNKKAGLVVKHRYLTPAMIKAALPFTNPIVHPAVMFRRSSLPESFAYDNAYLHAEDYGLWISLIRQVTFGIVPEALVLHRAHDEQISVVHHQVQLAGVKRAQRKLFGMMGIDPSEEQGELHLRLFIENYPSDPEFITQVESWLQLLLASNERTHVLPSEEFRNTCGEQWFRVNQFFAAAAESNYTRYKSSELSGYYSPALASKVKLLLRSVKKQHKPSAS